MSESIEAFASVVARLAPLPIRPVGFSALVLYPPGCAQEGSLFKGFPTWRFRVLKTALRLRPRRALSSASGQNDPFSTKALGKKSLKTRNLNLTNHIPVYSWLVFTAFRLRFAILALRFAIGRVRAM